MQCCQTELSFILAQLVPGTKQQHLMTKQIDGTLLQ